MVTTVDEYAEKAERFAEQIFQGFRWRRWVAVMVRDNPHGSDEVRTWRLNFSSLYRESKRALLEDLDLLTATEIEVRLDEKFREEIEEMGLA